MPVLINTQTGAAEDLSPQMANQALAAGTHQVALNDPQGNPVAAPMAEASKLLQEGYTQPSTDQLKYLLTQAKFGTSSETVKALGEAAGRGALPFGAFTAIEKAFNVPTENIEHREEFLNPIAKFGAESVGLIGSNAIPFGQGHVLGEAGKVAAQALGAGEEAGVATKALGMGARFGTEAALYAAGDEAHKAFLNAPDSAETAATNILLSGLMGGAMGAPFGYTSALWDAAAESKTAKILSALKDKASGVMPEGAALTGSELAEKAGIEIPHEISALVNQNPEVKRLFQHLVESPTLSGRSTKEALVDFKKSIATNLVEALGRTPEQVAGLEHLSENDLGVKLQESLSDAIKKTVEPLTDQFEAIKEKFKTTAVSEMDRSDLATKIVDFAAQKGLGKLEGDAEQGLINKVLSSLERVDPKTKAPVIGTLEDMRLLQSRIQAEASKMGAWDLERGIRTIFREAEDELVTKTLGEKAPELIAEHAAARQGYRAAMNLLDDLNDQLHVGKFNGAKSFLYNLKDMAPETLLNRLTPKNRADFLSMLAERFPETAEIAKQAYIDKLLKTSAKGAADQPVSFKSFFGGFDGWSPELKRFVLGDQRLEQVQALKTLLKVIPDRANPSGTAGSLMGMLKRWPSGAAAMASFATGHSPIAGFFFGEMARILGTEVPDAVKLATLRFLGNPNPVNAKAFKVAVDLAHATIKGENVLSKAVKNTFRSGVDILPSSLVPTLQGRAKLEKRLSEFTVDPGKMMELAGHTGYYLPDHGAALAALSSRALMYLNSMKPQMPPGAPLDAKMVPSQSQKAKYDRALDVATQPLLALAAIRSGTLTPEDVRTVKTIYPRLYTRMVDKLVNEVIEHKSKGHLIPYKQRLSLSLFMGQDLDSTMKPASILAAQPKTASPMEQQLDQKAQQRHKGPQMGGLNQLSEQAQLPNQARELKRNQIG